MVTLTSTVPLPAGLCTVSWVPSGTMTGSAPGLGPKVTAVAPVKPLPVTVTGVLPNAGPVSGVMLVTWR